LSEWLKNIFVSSFLFFPHRLSSLPRAKRRVASLSFPLLFIRPHSLILLPERRTIRHYKSKLHIYHLNFISLLTIF